jgi:predicted TPR repeat methyltransferase
MLPDGDRMLFWIAIACREARESAGRLTSQIAAERYVDQSTVTRFETGTKREIDVDAMVAAYARDLDIDPRELWRRALELWRDA